MEKLQEMKQKTEEVKARLETTTLQEMSPDGHIVVTINGNRRITDLLVDREAFDDREEMEDLLLITINRAIEKANTMHETEMAAVAQGMLPGGLPGM